MIGSSESQSTLEPRTDAAQSITDLWWFMFVVATIVVAVVLVLVFLAVLRRRGAPAASGLRRRLGGQPMVLVGGVAVPLVVLAIVFALSIGTLEDTAPADAEGGLRVEVTGRQWFWDVSYPGAGAVTANEIHVPTDTPVTIAVESTDVAHSFWVPQLNRKIDLIPGKTNEVSFEVPEPGVFRGQCAEYCGLQHANMAFRVVAEPQEDFDQWLARMAEPADEPATPSAAAGEDVFMGEGCAACHTVRGTEAVGEAGPDLTHLASRETIAAVTLENDRGDLGGWVLDPQHVKPGAKMPATDLSGPQLQDLLHYLAGLD